MIHKHGTYVITEIGPDSGWYRAPERDNLIGLVIHPEAEPRAWVEWGWVSVRFRSNKLSAILQGLSPWWWGEGRDEGADITIYQCRLRGMGEEGPDGDTGD